MWTIDLNAILVWYWLLAITIVLMTFTASIIHKTWIPAMFGAIIGGILVLFASYLEPALFGWLTNPNIVIQILSLVFFVMWLLAIAQALYNGLRYGRVTA